MAEAQNKEVGDDFSYIIRLADTDIDGLKKIQTALTSVRGIGVRTAAMICDISGLERTRLAGDLSEGEQEVFQTVRDKIVEIMNEYNLKYPT